MSEWSPPSIPRTWAVAVGLVYAIVLAYSFVVAQQFLVGLLPGFFLVGLYLLWRFLAAVEAIADAHQRLARQRERE